MLRNICSRLAWCCSTRSATRPSTLSSPWLMMATRSQTVSTSPSSWEEKKTVLPFLLQPLDDLAHLHAAQRVQAAGRLVEDQQVRVVDQGLGQSHPLLHALGIGLDGALAGGFQLDELQQLVNPPVRLGARECRRRARRNGAAPPRSGTCNNTSAPAGSRCAGGRWARAHPRRTGRPPRWWH